MKRLVNKINIVVLVLVCACIHLLRIHLRGFIEDPDVGTFILLSHSFWSGDIFYQHFFDPKLPHLLPIYSLSLLSGSIAGHLIVTLLCICATALVINQSGRNIWGGVFYVPLILLSPGGATGHLAVFANFLIACSYYCLSRARYTNPQELWKNSSTTLLVTSGILAGWAIGLRPNYGFALVPLSTWFILQRKLDLKRAIIWCICCFITVIAPIFLVLKWSDLGPLGLFVLLRSWNVYFYGDGGVSTFADGMIEMYSHPIGPLNLGILVSILVFVGVFSASRASRAKIIPFVSALGFLWFSYFISHTYNHYILMDLLIVGLLISSMEIQSANIFLFAMVGLLCILLVFSPSSPHSDADSLMIENRTKILAWLRNANVTHVVSPVWLTPHWVHKSKVPTKGIHPEWSIGIIDRKEFKQLDVVQELDLDVEWEDQCKRWQQNASTFIATQELFKNCQFNNFEEVTEFNKYPLRVWVKKQ